MKELKVGQTMTIKCVEADKKGDCTDKRGTKCVFWGGICGGIKCLKDERTDGREVVFVEDVA